nr:hypothetical protein [uncultured organism]
MASAAASVGVFPVIEMASSGLDHDDCIVNHDADGKDDGEQGGKIDGETEQCQCAEGADDGDRHRSGRHQHRAPILQEDEDDNQHEERGFHQGVVDIIDGGLDEQRRVERHGVAKPFGKVGRHDLQFRLDRRYDVKRIGLGQQKQCEACRRLSIETEILAVLLSTQLYPCHVAQAHKITIVICAQDDVFEGRHIGELGVELQRVLEIAPLRHRWKAKLAGGRCAALLTDRVVHI